jgi:fumarate reductase subunit C
VTTSPAKERERYPVLVPKMPRTWWLRTSAYRRFFAREITAVFVGAFSVVLLLFLLALSRGREAYEAFLRWLELPAILVLHAVILAAALYHTATWLRITAVVQVVRLGGKVVPRQVVAAALLGGWVVVSAVLAYLHVWF